MTHNIIKPRHLERVAYVYLRQSSPGQVRKNVEGRQRQQAMVDRVAGLGWPQSRIILLDQDNGRSGSSQHGRQDMHTLLEGVVTGKAGLVAARELSRLIRDNDDWARLCRLCRFENVLLADEHRLYDAADPQDRMVLGIQGAFNEFELSMIVDRMHQAQRQKAERGEQYDALPAGYICRHPPLYEKHPDPRVQRAVEKVLHDFTRFSSARQLYLHLIGEMFQLPVVRPGRDWREIEWIEPSYTQILGLVRNPAYAGLYVRGRTKAFTDLDSDGNKQTKRRHVPRNDWEVFLEDHHDAYIKREDWERNLQKIESNTNVRHPLAKGAVGRGCSLMSGLLRCRRCGHRLQTRYSSAGVRYVCLGGGRQRTRGAARCQAFSGTALERLLEEEILEVVGPAGLEAATRAADRLLARHQEQRQLLTDRMEAAVEAEQRAAREYKQTDATYVAVRQALAAEWESALDRVATEQSRLAKFDERQPTLPTRAQREELVRLGEDVRRLWNHPRASGSLKQQLARVLIQEIVADSNEKSGDVVLVIHWAGGHHTELRQRCTNHRGRLASTELKRIVETLRKVLDDASIATALNRENIRTAAAQTWTPTRVKAYRRSAGIPGFDPTLKEKSGWLTQAEAATWLEISPMSVHRLVCAGILPVEQPDRGLPMVISTSDLDAEQVQRAVSAVRAGQTRPLPDDPRQLKMF